MTTAKYDSLAEIYDLRWRRYIDRACRAALKGISLSGTERVLDVPVGTGEFAPRILADWPNVQLTGADFSRGMLRRARRKLPDGVPLVCCDAAALPMANASFDLVACLSSFHYFHDPVAALSEFRRVLRPGGRLLLLDWCDDYWACKICSLWLKWTDPAFVRTYSHAECCGQLQQAGFAVESGRRIKIDRLWGLMRFVAASP